MKQLISHWKPEARGQRPEGLKHLSGFRLLAAGFIFALLFLASRTLFAQPVSLILTERVAAYEKVAQEIESGLGSQVKSYDLQNSQASYDPVEKQVKSQKPSLIIALGDKAAYMASERFNQTPILVGMVLELEVDSLKRSGIEGVALQIPAQSVLTQLKLILPDMKKIGVISSNEKFNSFRESIRQTGSGLGVQVSELAVHSKAEIDQLLNQNLAGLDAVWLLPDPTIVDSESFLKIVSRVRDSKKALVVYSENFVKAGALFSISPDYQATGQQLVLLAKKMLARENVKPEVSYLGKFSYPIGSYSVLNMKTAQTIHLKLNGDQLRFIDRVVNGE
jgi:putative ABC transport system substrate-binding protein